MISPRLLQKYVRDNQELNIAVLVSGDPCLYSFTPKVQAALPDTEIEIVPGISSFQYLAAKLGLSWNDSAFLSFHGRGEHRIADTAEKMHRLLCIVPNLVVFTDREITPGRIAMELQSQQADTLILHVGCNLGQTDEKIISFTVQECAEYSIKWTDLCVMIIEKK